MIIINKKKVKNILLLTSLLLIVVFIMGVSYAYTHANFFNRETGTTIAVNYRFVNYFIKGFAN